MEKNIPEYDLVPCPCPCHSNPSIMHIVACCEGGFIKRIKQRSAISDEVRKQIEDYAESFKTGGWFEKIRIESAEFGYSLASKALSDANKEIERLKKEIVDLNKQIDQAFIDGQNSVGNSMM